MINNIVTVVSTLISLLAVCVSAYAVSSSRKSKLTAAYFDKMTNAYERFMEALISFFYTPSDDTRNEFSAATHIAVLYSSVDAAKGLQKIFDDVTEYARTENMDIEKLEEWVKVIPKLLHKEIGQLKDYNLWKAFLARI